MAVEGFRLIETFEATVKPTLGHLQAFLCILIVTFAGWAFVKSHHDVCTDDTLRIHYILRGEEVFGTVEVRTKFAAFIAKFADAGEGEYLKTSRVSKDGSVPRCHAPGGDISGRCFLI